MKHPIRRLLLGILLALAAATLIGAPAQAAELAPHHLFAADSTDLVPIALTLDLPQLLNLLLAVVFPVLVGLVTKTVTRSGLKAFLLATISLGSGLVSAVLAAYTAGVPFDLVAALLTGLAAWIIAIATHYGLWKPSGVTARVQAFGSPPTTVTPSAALRAELAKHNEQLFP